MKKIIPLLIGLVLPALGLSADLEGRVRRLENMLSHQRGSEVLLELQRLRQAVQQLRGQLEEQGFRLDRLEQQQRAQYQDLDNRLRNAQPKPLPKAGDTGAPPPTAASPIPDRSGKEERLYRKAFGLLKKRQYEAAVAAFQEQLRQYPKGPYADNAHYWLGEAFYVKRDYSGALAEFQRLLYQHPQSPKVPGALLKIGYIQDERKNRVRARTVLEDLIRRFPQSTEARLARARLARMAQEVR